MVTILAQEKANKDGKKVPDKSATTAKPAPAKAVITPDVRKNWLGSDPRGI